MTDQINTQANQVALPVKQLFGAPDPNEPDLSVLTLHSQTVTMTKTPPPSPSERSLENMEEDKVDTKQPSLLFTPNGLSLASTDGPTPIDSVKGRNKKMDSIPHRTLRPLVSILRKPDECKYQGPVKPYVHLTQGKCPHQARTAKSSSGWFDVILPISPGLMNNKEETKKLGQPEKNE